MSRVYEVLEQYVGDATLAEYTFDFKIATLFDLLIIKTNADNTVIFSLRGDDDDLATYLSIVLNSNNEGGTLTLVDELEADYKLTIRLAPDMPRQGDLYRAQGNFTLRNIEESLDYQNGCIQRLADLAKRSARTPDQFQDIDFDPTLPAEIVGAEDNPTIMVNDDGDGFTLGPTASEISNAQGYATDAAESAEDSAESATQSQTYSTAAAASATAASLSAAAAAASAALLPFNVIGTRGAPITIDPLVGILFTSTSQWTDQYVQSNGGAGVISAAARIQAGNLLNQRLRLRGRSDANYLDIADGNGIKSGGQTVRLGVNSVAEYVWDGVDWNLDFYNSIMP